LKITRISELGEKGSKACLIGVVIHSIENFMVLEDGTGRARIYTDYPQGYGVNSVLLVVGRVISDEGEIKEVWAEAVVDLSGIDLRLLKRALELEEELEELEKAIERGV